MSSGSAQVDITAAQAKAQGRRVISGKADNDEGKGKNKKGARVHEHAEITVPGQPTYLERGPQGGQPATTTYASGTNTVRFEIKRGPFLLKKFWIEFTGTETGGSNTVTPVPTPYAIKEYKIYGDHTSKELEKGTSERLLLFQRLLPKKKLDKLWALQGGLVYSAVDNYYHRTRYQPLVLAASATRNYRIELTGNFIERYPHGFWLEWINEDMIVELTFHTNNIGAGSGTFAASNWKICMRGENYTTAEMNAFRQDIGAKHCFKTLEADVRYLTGQDISSVGTDTIELNSFRDKRYALFAYGYLTTTLLSNRNTIATTYPSIEQFVDIGHDTTIDILDSNKQKLRGETAMPIRLLRELAHEAVPNSLFENTSDWWHNLNCLFFVKDWGMFFEKGTENFSHYLAGNDTISQYRPTVTSAYTVMFQIAVFSGEIELEKGLWNNKRVSA